MIWIMIIVFLLGASFGSLIYKLSHVPNAVGQLRIDSSDPEDGPYLFLELETDPDILKRKEYIYLKVNTESYVSQK